MMLDVSIECINMSRQLPHELWALYNTLIVPSFKGISRVSRLSVVEKNDSVHRSVIHKESLSDNPFILIVGCEEQATKSKENVVEKNNDM